MTEEEIRRILEPMDCTVEPGYLHCSWPLIEWPSAQPCPPSHAEILLDGTFTLTQL